LRKRSFLYTTLLVAAIAWLWWYPLQVIQAISGFSVKEGAFVGADGNSQIFAFSIAGAIISFVLMSWWIFKKSKERKTWKGALTAVAVAYICTIAVTMWYEQIYANLWDLANHTTYWLDFYTTPYKFLEVVVDMSLVFTALPWMRKSNSKWVVLFSCLTIGFFVIWFRIGFVFPTTSALAYFCNGASRISSQLAIAFSVFPGAKRQNNLSLLLRSTPTVAVRGD
jgi:hypothetical protein